MTADKEMARFAESTDPRFPYAVNARLKIVAETALANLEAINERLKPRIPEFNRRAQAIVDSPKSKVSKIHALWTLIDDVNSINGGHVACRRGCNHCCHTEVLMSPEEAEAVGKRIGRMPRHPRLRGERDENFDCSYSNPCTFLKDGECSIYENRPVACRAQYSLDVDALLCEIPNDEPPRPVPYQNPTPFNMILLHIVQPRTPECMADIREYFPRKPA
ncbi:Flagellin N-methylase [Burkholderia pseudomallei]|uniref:YkgJ family cysteine cluster protein n=1 Tax=Burkholderia pseudomallei TaxID=28450 RepID=UPI0005E6B736|nr:YkgJ family cysteine cluster protein [Burkholderia pseudomallei]CAK1277813.1 Flagellin N-methylase [Burkholderia pseudomallei]